MTITADFAERNVQVTARADNVTRSQLTKREVLIMIIFNALLLR